MEKVIAFIESCENREQRAVLFRLHELIVGMPGVRAVLKYKIPFYERKSWVCYLNLTKNGGIELGFTRANELADEQGLLDFRGRKQVAGRIFFRTEEIDEAAVLTLLDEAILLDDAVPYASKRQKK